MWLSIWCNRLYKWLPMLSLHDMQLFHFIIIIIFNFDAYSMTVLLPCNISNFFPRNIDAMSDDGFFFLSDAVATYYLYMTYVHPFIFSCNYNTYDARWGLAQGKWDTLRNASHGPGEISECFILFNPFLWKDGQLSYNIHREYCNWYPKSEKLFFKKNSFLLIKIIQIFVSQNLAWCL